MGNTDAVVDASEWHSEKIIGNYCTDISKAKERMVCEYCLQQHQT